MHRCDHFIFEHPSNASSWNEYCIRRPIAQSSEFEVDIFLARSMATVKSSMAEKAMALKAAEKVATVKSDVENVAVEKVIVETTKTIIVEQAECLIEERPSRHGDGARELGGRCVLAGDEGCKK